MPDIKSVSVTALGMLKGACCWLTCIIRFEHFAVEVQVSVDAVLNYIPACGINTVSIKVFGKQVQNLICGCQLYLLTGTEGEGLLLGTYSKHLII